MKSDFGVIIVGAGPAGIGVALALRRAGVEDFLIVDAKQVGASFAAWPAEMRMITPSFHSNPFGYPDLNAVDPETSPADFLRTGHPTGKEYAAYLQAVVTHHELPVRCGVKVTRVVPGSGGFSVVADACRLSARMVVWAVGQFFHPETHGFPGADECLHSSAVADWKSLAGDEFAVIGGNESGMDAALNLCELGKNVRLHSRGEPWAVDSADPSHGLSPRTLDRIRELLARPAAAARLEMVRHSDIRKVVKGDGWWVLYDQDEMPTVSRTRPILATGYLGGLAMVDNLFAAENGRTVFSESCDESTITPGLFYSGPELTHRGSLFCFIYKFRSRFGLVAREIATRLGIGDADERLRGYAAAGFMNQDLECCTACECALEPVGSALPGAAEASQDALVSSAKR